MKVYKESAKQRRVREAQQEAERRRKLVQEYISKAVAMEEKSARPSNFPEQKHGPDPSN